MTNAIAISDLTKAVQESNLPTSKAEALEAAFMPFFEQAAKHCETAFSIKVTNIGQTAAMGDARRERLALREIRVAKEKVRKQVKEDALREGKAIDKIANFLDSVIEPMEKYLSDQEEYGKRLQEKIQAEQRDLRVCEFGKYIEFLPPGVDLGTIAEEEHAKLLLYAKAQWNEREAEQNRIENERIEREQREAADREAMRAENDRLRKENEAREAAMREERAEYERLQREHEAAIAAERAERERLERAERERIAAENRAKMEADNTERERIRKEQAEKEAQGKAAMEAPDKEKLLSYAKELHACMKPYQFVTESAAEKCNRAAQKILEAIKILQS